MTYLSLAADQAPSLPLPEADSHCYAYDASLKLGTCGGAQFACGFVGCDKLPACLAAEHWARAFNRLGCGGGSHTSSPTLGHPCWRLAPILRRSSPDLLVTCHLAACPSETLPSGG